MALSILLRTYADRLTRQRRSERLIESQVGFGTTMMVSLPLAISKTRKGE
jgi:hypothetical protein